MIFVSDYLIIFWFSDLPEVKKKKLNPKVRELTEGPQVIAAKYQTHSI